MIVFKKGKDVCLKSGGMRMTVEEITKNGKILCSYISDSGEAKKQLFEASQLEYAERFRFIPEHLLD